MEINTEEFEPSPSLLSQLSSAPIEEVVDAFIKLPPSRQTQIAEALWERVTSIPPENIKIVGIH